MKLNKIKLTEREVQLLAFTALRGGITNPAAREEFCKQYDSSLATIHNIVSKLSRLGILIKKDSKVAIHPKIALDFNSPLILQLAFNDSRG